MTRTTTSRPLAILLAAALALGLWMPTLSMPQAQAHEGCTAAVVALPLYA